MLSHKVYISFNSRTPCGVRQDLQTEKITADKVSIHAPRAGCDDRKSQIIRANNKFQFTHPVRGATPTYAGIYEVEQTFQFTHPVRGATVDFTRLNVLSNVSIHAPRAGCDTNKSKPYKTLTSFNSRTPCGVRLIWIEILSLRFTFQFTHPVRGATEAHNT